MNYEDATAAVRAHFETEWANETPIAWPDVAFTPPERAPWVRFTMLHADGYQASIGDPGNNRQRRVGQVIVQVFQPQGEGSKQARQLADRAVDAFMNADVDGIHFHDVFAREIGNDGQGWYQINVIARFRYDHLT